MTDAEFDNYLKTRYQDQVAWYDDKAKYNKRRFYIFQTLVIVLPASATILALIQPDLEKPGLVTLTTLATVVGLITVVSRHQELWFNYRMVCETLRKEIHYYTARLGEYEGINDPKRLFVQRVEALISREHTMIPPPTPHVGGGK
jgi:hypothetical protein